MRRAGGAADCLRECDRLDAGAQHVAGKGAGRAFRPGRRPGPSGASNAYRSAGSIVGGRGWRMCAGRGAAAPLCRHCSGGHSVSRTRAIGPAHRSLRASSFPAVRSGVWHRARTTEATRGCAGCALQRLRRTRMDASRPGGGTDCHQHDVADRRGAVAAQLQKSGKAEYGIADARRARCARAAPALSLYNGPEAHGVLPRGGGRGAPFARCLHRGLERFAASGRRASRTDFQPHRGGRQTRHCRRHRRHGGLALGYAGVLHLARYSHPSGAGVYTGGAHVQ